MESCAGFLYASPYGLPTITHTTRAQLAMKHDQLVLIIVQGHVCELSILGSGGIVRDTVPLSTGLSFFRYNCSLPQLAPGLPPNHALTPRKLFIHRCDEGDFCLALTSVHTAPAS